MEQKEKKQKSPDEPAIADGLYSNSTALRAVTDFLRSIPRHSGQITDSSKIIEQSQKPDQIKEFIREAIAEGRMEQNESRILPGHETRPSEPTSRGKQQKLASRSEIKGPRLQKEGEFEPVVSKIHEGLNSRDQVTGAAPKMSGNMEVQTDRGRVSHARGSNSQPTNNHPKYQTGSNNKIHPVGRDQETHVHPTRRGSQVLSKYQSPDRLDTGNYSGADFQRSSKRPEHDCHRGYDHNDAEKLFYSDPSDDRQSNINTRDDRPRGHYGDSDRKPTLDDVLAHDKDLKTFLVHHGWFNLTKRDALLTGIRQLAEIDREEAKMRAKREATLAKLGQITQIPGAGAGSSSQKPQKVLTSDAQTSRPPPSSPKRSRDHNLDDEPPVRQVKAPRVDDRNESGRGDHHSRAHEPDHHGDSYHPVPLASRSADRQEPRRRRSPPPRDRELDEARERGRDDGVVRKYESYRGTGRRHHRVDFGARGDTRFFLLKSFNQANVRRSMEDSVWTTQPSNGDILTDAFRKCKNVVLFFSINKSKAFQGWARMSTAPSPSIPRPQWMSIIHWETTDPFRIEWINTSTTPFYATGHLKNRLNEDLPVLVGKDGQEIDEKCGRDLVRLMDQAEGRSAGGL